MPTKCYYWPSEGLDSQQPPQRLQHWWCFQVDLASHLHPDNWSSQATILYSRWGWSHSNAGHFQPHLLGSSRVYDQGWDWLPCLWSGNVPLYLCDIFYTNYLSSSSILLLAIFITFLHWLIAQLSTPSLTQMLIFIQTLLHARIMLQKFLPPSAFSLVILRLGLVSFVLMSSWRPSLPIMVRYRVWLMYETFITPCTSVTKDLLGPLHYHLLP